jgi:hypothetical protein
MSTTTSSLLNEGKVNELIEKETCFDMIAFDHVSIKEWLHENKGSIIFIDPNSHITCYKRTALRRLLDDPTSNYHKCHLYQIIVTNEKGDEEKTNVQESEDPGVATKIPTGNTNWYLYQEEVLKCIRNKHSRIFQIFVEDQENPVIWNRSMSSDIFRALTRDATSGWHCQEGSDIKIYHVRPIALDRMFDLLGEEQNEEWILNMELIYRNSLKINFEELTTSTLHFTHVKDYTISPSYTVHAIHTQQGIFAALSAFAFVWEGQVMNNWAIQSTVSEALSSLEKFFRSRREATVIYAFAIVHHIEHTHPLFTSPLNAQEACFLCMFARNPGPTEEPYLYSSCLLNACVENHGMYVAEFDEVYFEKEEVNQVYVSKSLSNLLRFSVNALLKNYEHREVRRGREDNQLLKFSTIVNNMNTTPFIVIQPYLRSIYPLDLHVVKGNEWRENSSQPPFPIDMMIRALAYSSSNFVSSSSHRQINMFNSFRIYDTLASVVRDILAQENEYVFVFAYFYDGSLIESSNLMNRYPVGLYLYQKIAAKHQVRFVANSVLYLSTITYQNHPTLTCAAHFDRYYFEDSPGIDTNVYTNVSIINLIRFVQTTMIERTKEF